MKKLWLMLLVPLFLLLLNTVYAAEKVCVYEFYSPGCPYCTQVSDKFDELEAKYPQLDVHKINVRDQPEFFFEVQKKYDISTQELSSVPKVFMGNKFWIGAGPSLDEFEPAIKKYLSNGVECPIPEEEPPPEPSPEPTPEPEDCKEYWWFDDSSTECQKKEFCGLFMYQGLQVFDTEENCSAAFTSEPVQEKPEKEHITFLGISILALADAVNPCELAVLILLLTAILVKYPEKKRKALAAGLLFTLAIYLCYVALGTLIIFGFKEAGSLVNSIWIYRALGAFAIVIGLFNIKDFFKKGAFGFEMAVPLSWRPKMKQIVKSVTSPLGAFVIGIIVSLFLLPCTSGPYFVAGGLLAGVPWATAIPWLLYYNLLFVFPMIAITLLVYFGFAQADKIQGWRERNISKLHLVAGLILTVLGFIILMGWI